MKKKVVILTTLLTAALAAGGFLYFTHTQALKKAAAAPAPPPTVSIVAGAVTQHDAQIDPRPYQALIDQYTGNLERDQAQLINAQANLTRYTQLGDKGWATPQLIETQKAQVGQLQAAIKADQALIDAAKVQLSFTRLTSPI